jgi:hypothetical protein
LLNRGTLVEEVSGRDAASGVAAMPRRIETVGAPEGRFKCGFPSCTYSKDNERDVNRHGTLAGHGYAAAAAAMAAIAAQRAIEGGRVQTGVQNGPVVVPDQSDPGGLDRGPGQLEGGDGDSYEVRDFSDHAAGEQYQEEAPERPEDPMDMEGPEEQQPDSSEGEQVG